MSHPPLTSTRSSKALIAPALHGKDGPAPLDATHLPNDLLCFASTTEAWEHHRQVSRTTKV